MTGRILNKTEPASKVAKPPKPHKDFPLTPHNRGQWCKKVRGKLYYFGPWDDPDAALNKWLEIKDHLIAGHDPREREGAWDIEALVDSFMDSKNEQLSQGELSQRTLDDYHEACKRFADFFGHQRLIESLDAPDFTRYRSGFPDTWGPVRINNEITNLSVMLNFAYQVGAIDRPFRLGLNFKRVSNRKLRLHRATKAKKEFTAHEIHQLLGEADVQLRAMIFLGINCGFGNADCGRLTESSIDLKGQWYEQLRHKTAIPRAAWLWPETVAAIRAAIDARYPNLPAELSDHVFVTKYRQAWYRETAGTDAIAAAFTKLAKKAGCHRHGVGFYALRHVFETVSGNAKDQIATNYVMGHSDASMAAVYREGIDPERIKAVCKHVRVWWLKGKVKPKKKTPAAPAQSKGGAK